MTHPHSSSNGIFTEITDRCRKVIVDLNEVTAFIQEATSDDQLGIAATMTRIQAETAEVLGLIQSVVFKVSTERRDIMIDLLKEIALVSEMTKQAHAMYLIGIYGQENAELIVSMAEVIAKGTSK